MFFKKHSLQVDGAIKNIVLKMEVGQTRAIYCILKDIDINDLSDYDYYSTRRLLVDELLKMSTN